MNRVFHAALLVSAFNLAPAQSQSPAWQLPSDQQRCPSKWGAKDERGSANHMGPKSVLRAARLIRTGEAIELGHTLSSNMPFSGNRRFDVHLKRTVMNPGPNRRGSNEELVVTELGQVGTQFDGFAHQTIGDKLYNCVDLNEVSTRGGFTAFGMQNVGTLMTRGVLLDIAGLKGVPMLPDNYEITVGDLQAALKRGAISLEPGDAVLIRTGWSQLWNKDNDRYGRSAPGLGVAAAEWLAKADPMLVGADNMSIEGPKTAPASINLPVHQIMLVVNGIHLLENLRLEELAAKGAPEFAFVMQPLKIQGGTGSTVAPVALR
jgi:kynurenine formamidase